EMLRAAPKRALWYRTLAVLGAVAVTGLLFSLNVGGMRNRLLGGAASPSRITSLAVLPLDNFSHDPEQEFFADGMTEELITELAQVHALRIISRTSAMIYKGTHKPLPEIARELHVDAIVEGSVLRSGDKVRITAQLVEAATDRHLWRSEERRVGKECRSTRWPRDWSSDVCSSDLHRAGASPCFAHHLAHLGHDLQGHAQTIARDRARVARGRNCGGLRIALRRQSPDNGAIGGGSHRPTSLGQELRP